MFRMTTQMLQYLNEDARNVQLEFLKVKTGMREYPARWKECVLTTYEHMRAPTSAMFVKRYFKSKTKVITSEMVEGIKQQFEKTLQEATWLDDKTRAAGVRKIRSMLKYVGYFEGLLNDKNIIDMFKPARMNCNRFFESIWKLGKFQWQLAMKELRQPVNKLHWKLFTNLAISNAYYNYNLNNISELCSFQMNLN